MSEERFSREDGTLFNQEGGMWLPGSKKLGPWVDFKQLPSIKQFPNGPFWASNDEQDLRIRQLKTLGFIVDRWHSPGVVAGPYPSLMYAKAAYWFELLKEISNDRTT